MLSALILVAALTSPTPPDYNAVKITYGDCLNRAQAASVEESMETLAPVISACGRAVVALDALIPTEPDAHAAILEQLTEAKVLMLLGSANIDSGHNAPGDAALTRAVKLCNAVLANASADKDATEGANYLLGLIEQIRQIEYPAKGA